MVELLLKAGADPNAAAARRRDPVDDRGADRQPCAPVKALLSRGASVDAKDESRGQTALMWAAAEGHAAVVRELVAAGADVQMRVPSGFTPLLFAVREGRLDVVRALLDSGRRCERGHSDGGAAPALRGPHCRARARARSCWPWRTRTSSWLRRCSTRARIRTRTLTGYTAAARHHRRAQARHRRQRSSPRRLRNDDQPRARAEARRQRARTSTRR